MITVLGASGFVGSHLVARLQHLGLAHEAPGRNEALTHRNLGSVIYCIGLTADWRSRRFETVEAHVCKLLNVLQTCDFDNLVYLSSTRVYLHSSDPVREEGPLVVNPTDPNDLFQISKAMGESLLLASQQNVQVVRLSNVYGNDFDSANFLTDVLRDVVTTGKVVLRTTLDSAKDYIHIDDVTEMLPKIALQGRHPIYNLASGENVSNGRIMATIQQATGCVVEVAPDAPTIVFPAISIQKLQDEFAFEPASLPDNIEHLVAAFRHHLLRPT